MADLRPPPTPVAMIVGTAIIAVITGYVLGMGSSLGLFPNPFATKAPKPRGVEYYDDEDESAEEDVDAAILDHAPNWSNGLEADKRDGLRATAANKTPKSGERQKWETGTEMKKGQAWEDLNEECKLVLIVRTDLGMTKGL
jgi:PTH2 family peptidyl-tRNA hydrolase